MPEYLQTHGMEWQDRIWGSGAGIPPRTLPRPRARLGRQCQYLGLSHWPQCGLREHVVALGLCSAGLVGDPLADLWPLLPSRGSPHPTGQLRGASGKHRRTGAVWEHRLGQRHAHMCTHTYTLYLHRTSREVSFLFFHFFFFLVS
jgi:hypothetical protein